MFFSSFLMFTVLEYSIHSVPRKYRLCSHFSLNVCLKLLQVCIWLKDWTIYHAGQNFHQNIKYASPWLISVAVLRDSDLISINGVLSKGHHCFSRKCSTILCKYGLKFQFFFLFWILEKVLSHVTFTSWILSHVSFDWEMLCFPTLVFYLWILWYMSWASEMGWVLLPTTSNLPNLFPFGIYMYFFVDCQLLIWILPLSFNICYDIFSQAQIFISHLSVKDPKTFSFKIPWFNLGYILSKV